jgi:outer membrane protein assembly factor BamB
MAFRHRRGILVAALWAVNATACAPSVKLGPARQERSWTAYLGGPRHDAAAGETLNPDPRPLWRVVVGRAVRGSPALGEGVLAVGTADRTVVLVDRGSGEVLWRQRVDGTIRGGPLLDEDRLYVGTEAQPEGRVYAIRLRDGKPIWRTRVGSVAAPLAFDGDALYAGTEDGAVVRLDAEHGSITWRRRLPGAVRVAPVPTPQGLAVATTADTLYLLDVRTGAPSARFATPGTVLATPALQTGAGTDRLYLGTAGGRILAVSVPAMTLLWERAAGDAVYGAPALAGDTLYILARNGTLWRIPVSDPAAAASQGLGIVATAGPTPLAGGSVLVGSVSGEVLLVDRAGTILWRAQVTGPIEEPPLVQGRQLVVVAGRGDIHAYR